MSAALNEMDEKYFVIKANFEETQQEFKARIVSLAKEREDVQKQVGDKRIIPLIYIM